MKHYLVIFLLVLLSSIQSYAQYSKEISLKMSIEDFCFKYDDNNELIIFSHSKDIVYDENSKEPGLPFVMINVVTPLGSHFLDAKIEATINPIKKDVIISPNPIPFTTNDYYKAGNAEEGKTIYENGIYPQENLKCTGKMNLGGHTVLSFLFSPFKYDSEAKVLCLYQDSKISVSYSIENNNFEDKIYDEVWLRALESIVINPEDIDYRVYTTNTEVNIASSINTIENTPIDYIIITSSSLAPSFAPLVKWKNTKGVRTIIATTEYINNNYVGNNLAVKIKKYIYDKHRSDNVKFVLLGGDDTVIPVVRSYGKVITNSGVKIGSIPTDIFYVCFDGNFEWNGNGNSVIGEVEDDFSIAPQVFISRLPIRNRTHISSYLNKLLVYEKTPNSITNWQNRVLMCGKKLFYYFSNNPLKSDAEAYGDSIYYNDIAPYYSGTRDILYDTNSSFAGGASYNLTRSNLQEQLANGYSFIDMNTHGNQTGWSMESGVNYTASDASALSSTSPSIITTMACHTNAFDSIPDNNVDMLQDPCLSEAFIRNPNSGVLSYYGCSRESWGYTSSHNLGSSEQFDSKFYNTLLSPNVNVPTSFATVATISKLRLAASLYTYGSMRWMYFGLNPVGDSEMPIYLNTPILFTDPTINRLESSISVNTGIPGCRICVMSIDDMGQTYYKVVNNTQHAVFDNVGSSVNISVCITKENYVPYLFNSIPEAYSNGTIMYRSNNDCLPSNAFSEISVPMILSCSRSNGSLQISTRLNNNTESAYILLKNISGLREKKFKISPDSPTLSINLPDQEKAVYIISLYVNNKLCESKRIVEL